MSNAMPKTSTLIITAPHRMTHQQREEIVGRLERQLPPDVGMVILDGGITAQVVGEPFASIDAIPGELLSDTTLAQLLNELRGLRAELKAEREAGIVTILGGES